MPLTGASLNKYGCVMHNQGPSRPTLVSIMILGKFVCVTASHLQTAENLMVLTVVQKF